MRKVLDHVKNLSICSAFCVCTMKTQIFLCFLSFFKIKLKTLSFVMLSGFVKIIFVKSYHVWCVHVFFQFFNQNPVFLFEYWVLGKV